MSIVSATAALLSEFRPKNTINGYCAPLSVEAGQLIDFFISSRADYEVYIVQLCDVQDGSSNVAAGRELAKLPNGRHQYQITSTRAWQIGCGWQRTQQFQVPASYTSGLYAAECRVSDGSTFHIAFVVRPSPGTQNPILVLANTNTWNAYNNWGGYSRYTGNRDREISSLSFARPNPNTSANYEDSRDAHLIPFPYH